jgi:hypothetical protein
MPIIQPSLAFTRYLYQMVEVKQSLFLALLDHKPDEALYWTYELYYSGFKPELYNYILMVYITIYKKLNPSLQSYIDTKHQQWLDGNAADTDIGSIVYTMALRSYCLVDFMRTYLGANISSRNIDEPSAVRFIVNLTPDQITPYADVDSSNIRRNKVLEHAVKHPVRKDCHKLFNTLTHQDFVETFRHKWLYYASFSPIWDNRISQHNGHIDYDAETVTFADDHDEDAFRNLWDYEPDEVIQTVFTRCCGTGKETQLSVKDFCEKYNYTIVSRIIKRPLKTGETLAQTDM